VFGATVPSGRAPLTWYYNAYASDASPTAVSMLDMSMRPSLPANGGGGGGGGSEQGDRGQGGGGGAGPYPPHGPNPGRTYRFLTKPAFQKFPFGHGTAARAPCSRQPAALADDVADAGRRCHRRL
jgi:hypothetical protein